MVNVILPDCIILDIVARLPTKILYRFRCVSKNWNSLIRDPYFIKMRSRRMILLPSSPIQALDHNYPNNDMANLAFKCRPPYINPQYSVVIFLGTVNGIVLLVKRNRLDEYAYTKMILYNPFTGASKLVPHKLAYCSDNLYGFGHGATVDDLKIVIIDQRDTFQVFSFRTNSWSRSRNYNIENIRIIENDHAGTFHNGYLHWTVENNQLGQLMIMALNLDTMVLSYIPGLSHDKWSNYHLATLHGCLCIIDSYYYGETQLCLWVMKEQGVWSQQCLFMSGLEVMKFASLYVLDDGRILMMNNAKELVIYDTVKHSYKVIELSENSSFCLGLNSIIEYVETLASPADLFAV